MASSEDRLLWKDSSFSRKDSMTSTLASLLVMALPRSLDAECRFTLRAASQGRKVLLACMQAFILYKDQAEL
jgi:hypothetical protein